MDPSLTRDIYSPLLSSTASHLFSQGSWAPRVTETSAPLPEEPGQGLRGSPALGWWMAGGFLRNQAKSHETTQVTVCLEAPRVTFPICFSTDRQANVCFLVCAGAGFSYFAVEAEIILVSSLPGCISSDRTRWDEMQSIWCGFIIALLLTQNGCGPARMVSGGLFCFLGKQAELPNYSCVPKPRVWIPAFTWRAHEMGAGH